MDRFLKEADPELIGAVLDVATEVHREVGPGLLESAYESALCFELEERGIPFKRQAEVPFRYKGRTLGPGFRPDLVIDDQLVLELKCVDIIKSTHIAQMLTYLRQLRIRRGYLLNFQLSLMKHGIKRVSI